VAGFLRAFYIALPADFFENLSQLDLSELRAKPRKSLADFQIDCGDGIHFFPGSRAEIRHANSGIPFRAGIRSE
jgi:hypothetical protein